MAVGWRICQSKELEGESGPKAQWVCLLQSVCMCQAQTNSYLSHPHAQTQHVSVSEKKSKERGGIRALKISPLISQNYTFKSACGDIALAPADLS